MYPWINAFFIHTGTPNLSCFHSSEYHFKERESDPTNEGREGRIESIPQCTTTHDARADVRIATATIPLASSARYFHPSIPLRATSKLKDPTKERRCIIESFVDSNQFRLNHRNYATVLLLHLTTIPLQPRTKRCSSS